MEPVYCKEMIAVTALPGCFLLLGAPGIAGRSHATTLAGVRDQEIMLSLVAVGASEAVGEFQPGFEVDLDDGLLQHLLGAAAAIKLAHPGRVTGTGCCNR